MSTARILVIDDEVGMREGCRRALTPHGYQVSIAEHGAEGLRTLHAEAVDLVLLDAMMPGMSGLELLGRIREYDPDLVCIMITGYATVDLAAQAMKQGAHAFLAKPFTSDELLAVVQRGLQDRQESLIAKQQKEQEEQDFELKRVRQEIAKLDAIESRFMLVLVHELRNPAGVIKNYLQLMRGGYVDDDEWDDYLEHLDLRASQLLNMLDDLLELAHLKKERDPSDLVPVAVADILGEVVGQFRKLAESKGLVIEERIEARPILMAQPAHLRSLWTNLIDNAVSYTLEGKISVALFEKDGQMVTQVADTGIGLSAEEVARVFQEFYRSEAAKELRLLGTGLGLPIVEQIVKFYQGTVALDSIPGQGSTFTVTLPLNNLPAST